MSYKNVFIKVEDLCEYLNFHELLFVFYSSCCLYISQLACSFSRVVTSAGNFAFHSHSACRIAAGETAAAISVSAMMDRNTIATPGILARLFPIFTDVTFTLCNRSTQPSRHDHVSHSWMMNSVSCFISVGSFSIDPWTCSNDAPSSEAMKQQP